ATVVAPHRKGRPDCLAAKPDPPALERQEASQRSHEGALAGAVRPEDPDHLSRRDLDAATVEYGPVAAAHRDRLAAQEGPRHPRPSFCWARVRIAVNAATRSIRMKLYASARS